MQGKTAVRDYAIGFQDYAELDPDRAAFLDRDGTTKSAGEIQLDVYRIRRTLSAWGLSEGGNLTVFMDSSSALVEVYLAACTGGFRVLFLSPDISKPEVSAILNDHPPDLVLVCADTSRAIWRYRHVIHQSVRVAWYPSWSDLYGEIARHEDEPMETVAGDLLVTTSGTTGKPRVVLFPLPDLLLGCSVDTLPIPDDLLVLSGPHLTWGGMYGGPVHLISTILMLHLGRPVLIVDESDPEQLLDLLATHSIASVVLMPWNLEDIDALERRDRDRYDLSALRAVYHGGSPCPTRLKQRTLDWLGPILYEIYATTEIGAIAVTTPADWLSRPGTVGQPVETVEVRIVDDNGAQCGPSEVGNVEVVAVETSQVYRPDDVGYLDDEGWLYLSGRTPDVINVGTTNVYGVEIENAILGLDEVKSVAVVGVATGRVQDDIVAAVELKPQHLWSEELRSRIEMTCRRSLARTKVPNRIEHWDALPRGANNQQKRRQTPALATAEESRPDHRPHRHHHRQ